MEWWQEFVRVEMDRLLLFALVLVFYFYDPSGGHHMELVLGALIGLIQNNRWQRSTRRY
jgi:hypothetical protein